MRLLHTETLAFKEFYDRDVLDYAILSHRWGPVDEEVSHADFKARLKRATPGYAKIVSFCKLAAERGFEYCWIDTCCIDKTNSAELSEAINSMFSWYEEANVCYAYLHDVTSGYDLTKSDWFERGWTLQELLAPPILEFFNSSWRSIGTRAELKDAIDSATGIDEALLERRIELNCYSVAQRMSWAAYRTTTRLEDEAYCLMGLFSVNMPLLYGEGAKAFRRLQEEILASGEDTSLFAWPGGEYLDERPNDEYRLGARSILAPSPRHFASCGNVAQEFTSHRILFEVTNRGIMVLIHRSYNKAVLEELLTYSKHYVDNDCREPLGLTIPLSCYRWIPDNEDDDLPHGSIFLHLLWDRGKWRRVGVESHPDDQTSLAAYTGSRPDRTLLLAYTGIHYPAYTNDYVRLYIHDDWKSRHLLPGWELELPKEARVLELRGIYEQQHGL